jgi:peptidoglycan hydrolase-like protein with peptidoglycan-binding domain
LEVGSTGDDVKALQVYLNTHGFTLTANGPGSPGSETTFFGRATKAALIDFQKAVGISPTSGYFGPKTRAYIASH